MLTGYAHRYSTRIIASTAFVIAETQWLQTVSIVNVDAAPARFEQPGLGWFNWRFL
jgi:hypothetical protein